MNGLMEGGKWKEKEGMREEHKGGKIWKVERSVE
jgi:hypothetical protein